MYGKARDTHSKLLESAYKFNKTILVDTDLDWVAGDDIAVTTSNQETFNSEQFKIKEYDPLTGIVTLDVEADEPGVEFFHFGGNRITGDWSDMDGNDLDFRSDVLLLTRHIKIDASTDDFSYSLQDIWGARVLVADFYEKDWSY